ncbi:hypothetical protein C8F01DRAFT_1148495 [Mycena amicta]|nr:hypothetical protein C8F01DRAFT_1148495 [Mycena amicta]
MSSLEKRPRKLPACDVCKARRVLCHPQLNGAPCPRCIEKNAICTTTPVPRGRPRKHGAGAVSKSTTETRISIPQHPGPVFQSSLHCPELTPDFVSHCFEAIKFIPQYNHPIIAATTLNNDIRAVSYQLHLLPPQSRVLALCIICAASLASFHPSVLGDGPRPNSFVDSGFFASASTDTLISCGVRRRITYRALRDEALKSAWESGILLQPSNENAVSCFLLDLMEQIDFCGPSRPWASAYVSHVRVLAPHWHSAGFTANHASQWAGYLMTEAITSTASRTPLLVTLHDQMLLSGPEPPPLDSFLASLEKLPKNANFSVLWTSIRTYLYHVTALARQLSETIAGDYPRLEALAEGAVLKFLTALTMLQSALALLTERVDALLESDSGLARQPDGPSADSNIRIAAYGLVFGFAGLALPFLRELEFRASQAHVAVADGALGSRERMRLLRAQARELCLEGARELAKALKRLPKVHYGPTPVQWRVISSWAEYCVEEAQACCGVTLISVEVLATLEAFSDELKLLGYSLHGPSTPHITGLIDRLDSYVHQLQRSTPSLSSHSQSQSRSNSNSPVPSPPHLQPPLSLSLSLHSSPSSSSSADFFDAGATAAAMLGHSHSHDNASHLGLGLGFGDVDMSAFGGLGFDRGHDEYTMGAGVGLDLSLHQREHHGQLPGSMFGSGLTSTNMGMEIGTQWLMESAG